MYTALLADCDPAWPVHAGILNNRGITWLDLQQDDAAAADFTAVVDAATATDEARACALNNRADILENAATSAARLPTAPRYSASETRATTGATLPTPGGPAPCGGSASTTPRCDDIDALLATADIVMEQKMAARLQRAGWLASAEPDRALDDLKAVITSPRNFPQVEERASLILGQILGKLP